MDKVFKAPWDTLLRSISALMVVIMIGLPAYDWWDSGSLELTGHKYIIMLFPLLLIVSLLFTIRSYTINGNVLLVRRLFWNTRVDLSCVQSARFDSEGMKGTIKTLGNGGAFSYSGWFYSKRLGKFRALVTNRSECIILKFTDGKTTLVSPENPQLFIEALREIGITVDNQ